MHWKKSRLLSCLIIRLSAQISNCSQGLSRFQNSSYKRHWMKTLKRRISQRLSWASSRKCHASVWDFSTSCPTVNLTKLCTKERLAALSWTIMNFARASPHIIEVSLQRIFKIRLAKESGIKDFSRFFTRTREAVISRKLTFWRTITWKIWS